MAKKKEDISGAGSGIALAFIEPRNGGNIDESEKGNAKNREETEGLLKRLEATGSAPDLTAMGAAAEVRSETNIFFHSFLNKENTTAKTTALQNLDPLASTGQRAEAAASDAAGSTTSGATTQAPQGQIPRHLDRSCRRVPSDTHAAPVTLASRSKS